MAKFIYSTAVEGQYLSSFYDGGFKFSVKESGKGATFTDEVTGAQIVCYGKNIEGDANGLDGGRIDRMVFKSEGEVLVVATGTFNAKLLSDATEGGNFLDLQTRFFRGNDQIEGATTPEGLFGMNGDDMIKAGGGNDFIDGGKGDDILRGGGGDDTFAFRPGSGRDTIGDFDVGNAEEHEYLQIDGNFDVVRNKQGDAVIVLSGDDRLTLEGVSRNELEQYHFPMPA